MSVETKLNLQGAPDSTSTALRESEDRYRAEGEWLAAVRNSLAGVRVEEVVSSLALTATIARRGTPTE